MSPFLFSFRGSLISTVAVIIPCADYQTTGGVQEFGTYDGSRDTPDVGSDKLALRKPGVVSPRGALAAFIVLLGLTLFLGSNANAQITVRQAASAQAPDENCVIDWSSGLPVRVCTPSMPATLTLNFSPTLGGDVMGVWSDSADTAGGCTDSLGQLWTTVFLGSQFSPIIWSFPPSGGQTAGITSLTCRNSGATFGHFEFIEISGVSSVPQYVAGPVAVSSGALSCGTVDPNAIGLFRLIIAASYGAIGSDPGPPSQVSQTSNLTSAAITSNVTSQYDPGNGLQSTYNYSLDTMVTLYAIAGTQPLPSTITVTDNNQGAAGSCWAIEFHRDFSADPGPCIDCELVAGQPINLATGDVWVSKTDYAVPGLSRGLSLTRTWNSLWNLNNPPFSAGMFGAGWTSDFEERLQTLDSTHLRYWLSSGNTWLFQQANGAYSLVAPLTEHASLAYNSSTALYTLTFVDGSTKTFNSTGYLTAVTDRNGNQTVVTYDSSQRISKVTGPGGQWLTFSYGNSTYVNVATAAQDSVGTVGTFSYSGNQLIQVAYPDGGQLNYAYDTSGNISTVTDALGKIVETHTVTVQYPAPGTATLTDSLSNSTTYSSKTIAGRGFITGIQGPGCDSCGGRNNHAFTQDSSGNRLTASDPNGNTASYTYDTNGNVLTKTDWVGTSTYTYNSFSEVLTAKDPLGNTATNIYDAKGNLTSTTTPSPDGGTTPGSKTQFAYDSKGELTQVTDPLGHATTLAYFSTGLINTIKDVQKNVTTFAYDGRGNRTSVKDALNNTTTFTYDSMQRLTKITYPNNSTTQIAYDKRGRPTSATDANTKTTTYVYDDADRLTSTTDPATNVTQYGYDSENNLTSITDALNHLTTFTYDFLGRVTRTLFPSNLSETYLYDNNGNLTTKTDRNGSTINYVYDQVNRLTQKSYPNSTAVNYTYDADGRLTQVTDPTGTYSFTFDNMGRLTATTTSYAFLSGRNFTTHYGYDATSNRKSFTDPESGSTSYVYDTLNRLTSLTPPSAISSGSFGFSYDALSRRTQLTRPNAVNTNYTYDTLSRLLSVTHGTSGHGATTLDGASYTVDTAGNRTSRTPLPGGTATNYAYDAVYELLSATQGSTTKESYSYDKVGNRLSSLGVPSYVYNNSNELTSSSLSTFTFDSNGNTLTKTDSTGTTTYAWDFENRLSSVTLPGSGGTVTFKYDPFGPRIYKSSSTATSIYAYDGDNLIEETNPSGGVVARYSQTQNVDEPLAVLRSAATSYFHADGLGSVTSLSNAAGSIANTYIYDSFGKLTASTGSLVNPFQYTARESDSETGLYYYRARYYDPQIGRFIKEDPTGFLAGENFYAYAFGSPTNWIDPMGLDVTVKLYPATNPYGHIGIGVNTMQTEGFYPDVDLPAYPGHIKPDLARPIGCMIIHTSPQQDQDIQNFINRRKKKPGWWKVPGRDCSNFVHDALQAGGINLGDASLPPNLWKNLAKLPHDSCYNVTPIF